MFVVLLLKIRNKSDKKTVRFHFNAVTLLKKKTYFYQVNKCFIYKLL